MEQKKKKTTVIVIGVIMVIVSAAIGILSGSPHNLSADKGSTNTIEFNESKVDSALTKYEEGLNELVQQGYLDVATHDIALAAGKKYDAEVISKSPTPIELITLSALKSNNLISNEIYDKLKTALDQQTAATKKEKFNPLVTSGAFTDIEKAEMAYNSFFKHYQTLADEQKAIMNKEIEAANPPLSDVEKKKKIIEFQKGQKQRIDDVLSKMISANELTQVQSDALKEIISK